MLTQEFIVKFTFCENNIACEKFLCKIIHIYYKFHELLQNIWLYNNNSYKAISEMKQNKLK